MPGCAWRGRRRRENRLDDHDLSGIHSEPRVLLVFTPGEKPALTKWRANFFTAETFCRFPRFEYMRAGLWVMVVFTGITQVAFKGAVFKSNVRQNSWDSLVLIKANTAADDTSMTATEKEVIFYTNLARLDPKKFADTYAASYIKTKVGKETTYTRSLIRDLKKTRNMGVLVPGYDLFQCAREHAIKAGKKGTMGHQELAKRMKNGVMTGGYVGA